MSKRWARGAVALSATVSTLGMMAVLAGAARADYAPSSYDYTTGKGDIVGVGSDTVQIIGNFLADGDQNAHPGFNNAGNKYKMVSLDATADANVRVAYSLTSTVASPQHLDPTVYFRAGQFPAQRSNGSGAGYNALIGDVTATSVGEKINFVRGSSPPSQTILTDAVNLGWGGLHLFEVASDNLGIVYVSQGPLVTNTDVPAALDRAQLAQIYQTPGISTWNQLVGGYVAPNPTAAPGTTGNCATCTVWPQLPQSGSGTRKQFLSDIGVADTAGNIASNVNQFAEENDPTAFTGCSNLSTSLPQPADCFGPMSGDRLNLFNASYFHNPHAVSGNIAGSNPNSPTNPANWPGGLVETPGVTIQNPATPASDGATAYQDLRPLFIGYRAIDDNDPGWQPGSTTNWAHALFNGSSSFMGSTIKAKNLVQAAGGTYAYKDCGVDTTTAQIQAACPSVITG